MLLATAVLFLLYSCGWEYSVRRYLDGFSDAIVPDAAPTEQKIEAILDWMRIGPFRSGTAHPEELSLRDPQTTLNYKQLLSVCGTATNAFLNLARSSDLSVRRLLLLDSDSRAKHVVAEVLLDGRWVIVDPAYRVILRGAGGRPLTRNELKDPASFLQATSVIPNYPPEYNYERFAHVRLTRLPFVGSRLRRLLDTLYPGWEEAVDWSLILERRSFAVLAISVALVVFISALRFALARYADRRLHVRRFRLREQFRRAGAALFTGPEIK